MLRLLVIGFLRLFYHVRVHGAERIPAEGGVILVGNHMTYVDAFVMGVACPRPVRFAMFEGLYNRPLLRPFLRRFGVVPISRTRAKEAIRALSEAAAEGAVVALFPEGQISRTGMMNELKKGFEMVARRADVPVVPVALDGLWGSIFSFERGRYFKKIPLRIPYRVTVEVGVPLAPGEATAARVRAEIEALGADAFARRPVLDGSLGYRLIRGLKRGAGRPFLIERAGSRQELSRGGVLAMATCLAERWRGELEGERVGVLLPGGSPVAIVNLGLVLAGKVPVNLPPAELPGLRETFGELGLTTLITSRVIEENFPDYPWPAVVRDLGVEVGCMSPGDVFITRVAAAPLSAAAVARGLKLPREIVGDGGEAVACITEDGRYVATSHRALVGNVAQLASTGVFRSHDTILSLLGLHEPGGMVFSLWAAALAGGALVTVPLRRDRERLVAIAGEEAVTAAVGGEEADVLLGVASPSLRLLLTPEPGDPGGAEPYRAAYFADPVSNLVFTCSLADPAVTTSSAVAQRGAREGSVGKLLPGFAGRLGAGGDLELRAGHLGDGGWRPTGLDGVFDREGFFLPEAGAV